MIKTIITKITAMTCLAGLLMVANLPLFNAFEAHVINVTAEIVNDIPSASLAGGQFCEGITQNVILSTTIANADGIMFTTDESNPTCPDFGDNGDYYTNPIPVSVNTTIKARTCHEHESVNRQSAIAAWNFTFVCCDGCGEDPEGSGVVLNEFLPNPTGDIYGDDGDSMPMGEWVELYNNGNSPMDLAGWYIKDEANHKIVIGDSNTLTTTVIGANGSGSEWLVVYMNQAILNNTGSGGNPADTVYLYDKNDNPIDDYPYYGTNCSLQPTPGGDNPDTPPSGCNQVCQVPENKSYARIPDGIGDFVDPVPTPGAPNILEVENLLGGSSSTPTPTPIPAPEAIPEPAPEPAASGSTEEPVIEEEEPTADESADELPDELIEEPLEGELIEELPGEELTGEDPVVEEPISEELTEEPIKEEGLNEEEELTKDEPADEPADEPNSEPSSEPAQTPDSKPALNPEPAPELEPQTQPAPDPDPVPAPEPVPSSQPTEE